MADIKISATTAITAPVATDEIFVASGGATKKIVAANLAKLMPGYELGYAQIVSDATTTQTTRASATTWLTAPSITFDGSTAVIVKVYFSALGNSSTVGTIVDLWEDSTDLGILLQVTVSSTLSAPIVPGFGMFRYTPTAGAKVLSARAWVTGASTGTGYAGAGTAAGRMPAYIRVIRA